MGIAEEAERIRAREAADAVERERQWAATREALDALAPDVVHWCEDSGRQPTRLEGMFRRRAWTFAVCTDEHSGFGTTCMHIAFLPGGIWELLGHHRHHCRRVVDKTAPFHPGLRQGFVFDAKRHEADVVMSTRDQLREAIISQLAETVNG